MISFSIDKQRDKVNAEWMSRPVGLSQPLALVLISMAQSPTFAYRLKRKLSTGPIFGEAYSMTRSILLLIFSFAFLSSLYSQIKILPLGNSITHGTNTHFSYRFNLWKKLTNEKVRVDFVGTMSSNYGGNPPFPDPAFDKHHEGHRGWRADQLLASLPTWLTKYTPDIVLMHVGTNDVFMGNTNESTATEIASIIDVLRGDNPNVTILLAKIIGTSQSSSTNQKIVELNQLIEGVAISKNTPASRLLLVDQYSGLDPLVDCYDGKHPNEVGEEKMAQKWFDNIMMYLQEADHTIPSTPVNLVASNKTETSFRVSWSASSDASGVKSYLVYSGGTFVVETQETSHNFTGLQSGTSHLITVRAKDVVGNLSASSSALNVSTTTSEIGDGLKGEYYNVVNLTGSPTITKVDAQVNFSWGSASPHPSIGTNNFSVRWTGEIKAPVSGSYVFSTTSDDGVRLWVNGQLVIDNWTSHSTKTDNSVAMVLNAGAKYPIKMEYFEASGGAVAKLLWTYPGTSIQPIPQQSLFSGNGSSADMQPPAIPGNVTADQITANGFRVLWNASTDNVQTTGYDIFKDNLPIGTSNTSSFNVSGASPSTSYSIKVRAKDAAGNLSAFSNPIVVSTLATQTPSENGIVGMYYNTQDLTGSPIITRKDVNIDFYWRYGSPGTGVNTNYFSVRWTGLLKVPVSGNYIFSTLSDDGIRVRLNNTLIIDQWTSHKATLHHSANVSLTAGQTYPIEVTYYEGGGESVVNLQWAYPGQSQQIIPQNAFYVDQSAAQSSFASAIIVVDDYNDHFMIYPNPASGDFVTIELPDRSSSEATVQIVSSTNREVARISIPAKQNLQEMSIAGLPPGVYFVIIKEGNRVHHQRLILL